MKMQSARALEFWLVSRLRIYRRPQPAGSRTLASSLEARRTAAESLHGLSRPICQPGGWTRTIVWPLPELAPAEAADPRFRRVLVARVAPVRA